jgi:hypothetical protein
MIVSNEPGYYKADALVRRVYNVPVELAEGRYGIAVERYAFREDPGGFGTHCGGAGVVLDYLILSGRGDVFVRLRPVRASGVSSSSTTWRRWRLWSRLGGSPRARPFSALLAASGCMR